MLDQRQESAFRSDPGQRLTPRQMLLAYVSGTFGFGFMGMAGFLVVLRAQELGAPPGVIGLIVGAGSLLASVLSVPTGALADRIGARQVYLVSTVLSGVGALLLAAADDYWALLALEVVFGFPRTMGWVASQAYITSVGTPEDRAAITGRFSFSASLGSLAAPLVIGAVAQAVSYQFGFLFLVPVAAVYTVVGMAVPDARSRPGAAAAHLDLTGGFGPAVGLLRLPAIQAAMALTFVRIWLLTGWFTFFRVLLAQQGFPPVLIGAVESSHAGVTMFASLATGPVARLGRMEVLTAGVLAIKALGVALSPYFTAIPVVFLPGVLMGIGNGLSLPFLLAIIGRAAPPEQRGVAMGLRTSANRVASTAAPVALGALMESLGLGGGFALSALASWCVLGAVAWCSRRDAPQRKPASSQRLN